MGLLSRFADTFGNAGGLFNHPQSVSIDEPYSAPVQTPFGAMTPTPPSLQDQVRYQAQIQAAQPNFANRLSALLRDAGTSLQGGHSDYQGQLRQKAADDLQTAQLRQQIEATVTDPQERLVALMNPKAWAENRASNFGAKVVTPGAVLFQGGQAVGSAPQVHAFDDRFGSFDPITGKSTYGEARTPTYEETIRKQLADQQAQNQLEMQQYRDAQVELNRQKLGEQGRHNRAQEGVAGARERRLQGQGGSGGGVGGAQSGNATLDAIARELQRRGKL